MTENCSQRPVTAMAISPWLWWTGLFLLLALGPTSALLSQEYAPAVPPYLTPMGNDFANSTEGGILDSPFVTGRSGQSFGAMVRGGYLTGPTVGRDKGIAPLEIMPYAFLGDGMFLADIRGFRGDRGDFGANMGLGYRQFIAPLDRIFGVNFFYDIDNTTSYTFNQLGFGIETLGELWDARANAYFPYGDRDIFIANALVDGSQHFVGHQLLYDVRNAFQSSLKGADAEIGFPLPGPFAALHDIRIFGGGYYYETADSLKFAGGSARLQGNVIPSVQLQLQVTHDDVFKTNVMFGAQLAWGGFQPDTRERPSQWSRMTTPIQRQYTISTTRTYVIVEDVVAFNESTKNPYFFNHVASLNSYDSNGTRYDYNTNTVRDGTVERPYLSIAEAETRDPARDGDIIFVHADSFYNGEGVTLKSGRDNGLSGLRGQELHVRYLGNGTEAFNGSKFEVSHFVSVPDVGIVELPTRNDGPGQTPIYNVNEPLVDRGDRPLYVRSPGDGVTLASFAEFSGFQVGNQNQATDGGPRGGATGPTGHGAFGDAVESLQLNQNVFAYAGIGGIRGDGIRLENALSDINIIDTNIINPNLVGLRILGGNPGIVFGASVYEQQAPQVDRLGVIQNQPGTALPTYSLVINGTGPETDIDLSNAAIFNGIAGNGSGDGGILILRTDGDILVGQATIIAPQGSAIRVDGVAEGGNVDFVRQIDISQRRSIGIDLLSNFGQIRFRPFNQNDDDLITIAWDEGVANPGTGAAINWQRNFLSSRVVFSRDIDILGSGGDGFALGTAIENAGNFQSTGNVRVIGDVDTGSAIEGIGVDIANNTGAIVFNSNTAQTTLQINNRLAQGIRISQNDGTVTFNSTTTVNNDALTANDDPSLLPAVDIVDNTDRTDVRFRVLTINDAAQAVPADPLTVAFGAGLSVVDHPALVQVDQFLANNTSGISLFALRVGNDSDPSNLYGLRINNQLGDGSQIIGNTALPAVWIEDSIDGVILSNVNSADSALDGIRLIDNRDETGANFGFRVLNKNIDNQDPLLSGGIITGAALAGVYAQDAGRISLNYLQIDSNGTYGVLDFSTIAEGRRSVQELKMVGNIVQDNTLDGLLAIDIREVTVLGDPDSAAIANFADNGTNPIDTLNADGTITLTSNHEIQLVSTELPADNGGQLIRNEWIVSDLNISHSLPNAAVFFRNGVNTPEGREDLGRSELLLTVENNQIVLDAPGTQVDLRPGLANLDPVPELVRVAGVTVAANQTPIGVFALWNGPIIQTSTIDSNQISFENGGAMGIAIRGVSTVDEDLIYMDILNNTLVGATGNNVGIYYDYEFASTGILNITGNQIQLIGRDPADTVNDDSFDVGIFVDSLDTATQINIDSNQIDIQSDNAVGVAFNNIFGFGDLGGFTRVPAQYSISNNDITLTTFTQDRPAFGFILGFPVGGNVRLNSNGDNTVNFVNTTNGVLVFPSSGAFSGTISVNGNALP